MAELATIGLEYIKLGDVDDSGNMPDENSMTQPAFTYEGTALLSTADGTTSTHYYEELDEPFINDETEGAITLTWSIVNYSTAALIYFKGGKVSGSAWEAPESTPELEKSIKVRSKKDVIFDIPRASITAEFDGDLSGSSVAKLKITATVLQPANDKPPLLIYKAPAPNQE